MCTPMTLPRTLRTAEKTLPRTLRTAEKTLLGPPWLYPPTLLDPPWLYPPTLLDPPWLYPSPSWTLLGWAIPLLDPPGLGYTLPYTLGGVSRAVHTPPYTPRYAPSCCTWLRHRSWCAHNSSMYTPRMHILTLFASFLSQLRVFILVGNNLQEHLPGHLEEGLPFPALKTSTLRRSRAKTGRNASPNKTPPFNTWISRSASRWRKGGVSPRVGRGEKRERHLLRGSPAEQRRLFYPCFSG